MFKAALERRVVVVYLLCVACRCCLVCAKTDSQLYSSDIPTAFFIRNSLAKGVRNSFRFFLIRLKLSSAKFLDKNLFFVLSGNLNRVLAFIAVLILMICVCSKQVANFVKFTLRNVFYSMRDISQLLNKYNITNFPS